MDSRINLDNNLTFTHTLIKNDYKKIVPTTISMGNLSTNGGHLVFQALHSINPLDICNAKLYFEIELTEIKDKEITLKNNFFPNMFKSMSLTLGSSDVEKVNEVGVATEMLTLVSASPNWSTYFGSRCGWIRDTNKGDTDVTSWDCNLGFYNRNKIYLKKKFAGYYPLRIIFGFIQNYNRVLFNTSIELTCSRLIDDNLIFFGNKGKGKLELKKLELHIPEVRLETKAEMFLIERMITNKPIKVSFLNRIVGKVSISTETTYSIKIGNLKYKPRYIFICFKDKEISFTKNNNLFIQKISKKVKQGDPAVEVEKHYYLRTIQIELNNISYPSSPFKFDLEKGDMNSIYDAYGKCCNDFLVEPQLTINEFGELYPFFCFDVSARDYNLNVNNVYITLHITKDENFKADLYWCILEEKHIEIKLVDAKVFAIENLKCLKLGYTSNH